MITNLSSLTVQASLTPVSLHWYLPQLTSHSSTGESFLKLADDVLDAYTKATNVRKGTKYFSSISTKDYEKLKPLVFVIGNVSLSSPDSSHIPNIYRVPLPSHPMVNAFPPLWVRNT